MKLRLPHPRLSNLALPRLCAAALIVAFMIQAASKAWADEQDQVRHAVSQGQYKPLTQIVTELSKRHPGRVLDVETKRGPQGALRYEITIADPQGHRQELLVDAATGQVIAQEAEQHDRALPMARLADYLKRVEQQLGSRVIDAEFEISHGKAHYKIKLAQRSATTQKVLMDTATGALLGQPGSLSTHAVTSAPDMLRILAPQFGKLPVLEIELEQDVRQGIYYEIELAQEGGSTLELHVDAQSGAVLRRRVED
ncbi:MAG: PepSY domain-containing protein [Ottowia sp.]